jgi:hypothetical protein
MKRTFTILLVTAFFFSTEAQNLVPNPGFEEYKHLPCEDGLYFIEPLLYDWIQPIPTTPDYWNSLAENIKYGAWPLTVCNRWGERVYFSEDYRNNWNGDDLPNGFYYYKLNSIELKREKKGWLNVFR